MGKKKKKKKKTAFDPDADGGDEEAAKEKKKVVFDEGAGEDAEDIDLESFGKKKKKKKVREGLDSMDEVKEALPEPAADDEDMDLDNLDDFGSKKKKKKKNRKLDDLENEETRLYFLQCMTCHSSCSVQAIKTGFQAITGKRKKMVA